MTGLLILAIFYACLLLVWIEVLAIVRHLRANDDESVNG